MLNRKHKILVVDDERAIVSARATILESHNYETATAFSGEEAVQVATSFQPDCIVSDITMGAMNGVEAALEILGEFPRCKVFFITGNVCCADLLEKAREKGFDFEVLQKPLPPPEMLARLEQICSQAGHAEVDTGTLFGLAANQELGLALCALDVAHKNCRGDARTE